MILFSVPDDLGLMLTPIGLNVPSPPPRRGPGYLAGVDQRFMTSLVLPTGSDGRAATGVTPGRIGRRPNRLTGRRPQSQSMGVLEMGAFGETVILAGGS